MRCKSVARVVVAGVMFASLACAAAAVAVWIRGYRCSDRIEFTSPQGATLAYTCRGGVAFLTQPFARATGWEWEGVEFGLDAQPYQAGLGPGEETWLGIRRGSYFSSMAHRAWAIAIPMWLIVAVLVLPAVLVVSGRAAVRVVRRFHGRGFPVSTVTPHV